MDATKKTISEFQELFLAKDVSSSATYYDSIVQGNISFVLERDVEAFTSDDVENYITAVNNAVGKASTGKFRPLYIDHEEEGVVINSSFPKRLYKGKRATLVKPLKFLIDSDFGQDWWKQWSRGQIRKGVITASEIRERIVKQLFYGGLTFREHFNFRAGSDTDNEKIIRDNEKLDIVEEIDEAGNKTKRLKLDDTLNDTIKRASDGVDSLEKIFSSFYTEALGETYNPIVNHNKLLVKLIKKYNQPVEKFQNFLKKDYSELIDKLIREVRADKSKLGTVIRIENVDLPDNLEYDKKENEFIQEDGSRISLNVARMAYEGDKLAAINQHIKNANSPMEEPDTFFDFLNSKEDIEAYFNKIATNQLISPNVDNLLGVLFELSEMAEREGNYEVLEEEIQAIMTNKAFDSNEKREQIERIERAIVDKLKNYSRLIKRGFAQKAKDFIENHQNYTASADVRGKLLRQLEEQNVIRRE